MLDNIKKEGAENLAKYLAYEKKKDGLINKAIGSKCNISVGEASKVLNCGKRWCKIKDLL